ncbi:hypothetical protein D7M10_22660 [Pseudomonas fluorescens]|jgi:hypothetical protein|uniref:Uncharacterized protein n=1 Tax=Pseudomonas shahriarae TaxID=2745512 RepID=A0ABT5N4Z1_9PSED|nr:MULTISPECIES: hypothetical protein [Pseudomonas]AYG09709.1 hypothetical protein D7M10_22660 [Pseudomonas fluorescens]MDZ4302923.1 hypothetical protein [Pseudomonas sp.]OAE17972.1 hypothetical protein A2T76_01615 [Pseudomonas brenneri]MBJ2241461.1 hypothetical protein [Pseudomonas sp. MF6768]MBJ2253997.1 hypothetical protein [Pseudomonas sp. MF6784]
MNSPTQPPVESAELADPDSLDSEAKPVIPAFKFPFKPGELAGAKDSNQPWYKNGAKNGHTKTPGMAPPGTRRSMGKR